jgi:hypothetical protein
LWKGGDLIWSFYIPQTSMPTFGVLYSRAISNNFLRHFFLTSTVPSCSTYSVLSCHYSVVCILMRLYSIRNISQKSNRRCCKCLLPFGLLAPDDYYSIWFSTFYYLLQNNGRKVLSMSNKMVPWKLRKNGGENCLK